MTDNTQPPTTPTSNQEDNKNKDKTQQQDQVITYKIKINVETSLIDTVVPILGSALMVTMAALFIANTNWSRFGCGYSAPRQNDSSSHYAPISTIDRSPVFSNHIITGNNSITADCIDSFIACTKSTALYCTRLNQMVQNSIVQIGNIDSSKTDYHTKTCTSTKIEYNGDCNVICK